VGGKTLNKRCSDSGYRGLQPIAEQSNTAKHAPSRRAREKHRRASGHLMYCNKV